jgi:hypothetical protein
VDFGDFFYNLQSLLLFPYDDEPAGFARLGASTALNCFFFPLYFLAGAVEIKLIKPTQQKRESL